MKTYELVVDEQLGSTDDSESEGVHPIFVRRVPALGGQGEVLSVKTVGNGVVEADSRAGENGAVDDLGAGLALNSVVEIDVVPDLKGRVWADGELTVKQRDELGSWEYRDKVRSGMRFIVRDLEGPRTLASDGEADLGVVWQSILDALERRDNVLQEKRKRDGSA